MKNKFILLLIVSAIGFSLLSAQQNNSTIQIADVQIKNNWIIVFNSNGKEISRMPLSKNEIVGIAGSFFVITANNWIITYNEK